MNAQARQPHAFTLTEVMISVALLLVIMIGVTEVFKTTSSVIGTSSAIADSIRGFRTVGSAMRNDFEGPTNAGQGVVKTSEMPFLVIRNQEVKSYMDSADAAAGTTVNRRVDTLAFFAKGSFRRATGQPATGGGSAPEELQVNQTGEDAWVWYGHLALPVDPTVTSMTWIAPGEGNGVSDNPYNYYAKDWVLGRQAILLKPRGSSPSSSELKEFQNSSGDTYEYVNDYFDNSLPLTPLQYNSPLKYSGSYTVLDSTCDLGGVQNYPSITEPLKSMHDRTAGYVPLITDLWKYISTNGTTSGDTSYRFHCNPFPKRPLEDSPGAAIKLSQASPQMLRGVSQYIVEFAGDFDTHTGVDVENSIAGNTASPLRIRWYGMPRDVDNDGTTEDRRVSALGTDMRTNGNLFEYQDIYTAGAATNTYNSVWGPTSTKTSVPTMIRITIEYMSPNGRMTTPVRQEFIYALPY